MSLHVLIGPILTSICITRTKVCTYIVYLYTYYIYCTTGLTPTIPVRLIPPSPELPFMGRVEVQYNDTWGTVCDDFFSTDDGRVVCEMLDFKSVSCVSHEATFGEGSGDSFPLYSLFLCKISGVLNLGKFVKAEVIMCMWLLHS